MSIGRCKECNSLINHNTGFCVSDSCPKSASNYGKQGDNSMKASETTLAITGQAPNYNYTPLPTFDNPTWWQLQGLSYTATGYGKKIPTSHMVKHNNRLKRVYCTIFSNTGTLYILSKGELIILS